MLEAAVALGIAVSTGLGVFASRINTRVNQIELRVAEKYIPREEVSLILTRFEDHMIRIENKLDNLLQQPS
jgi:uncharacterized coiled-coil protein SlyX